MITCSRNISNHDSVPVTRLWTGHSCHSHLGLQFSHMSWYCNDIRANHKPNSTNTCYADNLQGLQYNNAISNFLVLPVLHQCQIQRRNHVTISLAVNNHSRHSRQEWPVRSLLTGTESWLEMWLLRIMIIHSRNIFPPWFGTRYQIVVGKCFCCVFIICSSHIRANHPLWAAGRASGP